MRESEAAELLVSYLDPGRQDKWREYQATQSVGLVEAGRVGGRTSATGKRAVKMDITDAKAEWGGEDNQRVREGKAMGAGPEYWRAPHRARMRAAAALHDDYLRKEYVPRLYGLPGEGWHLRASVAETACFFLSEKQGWALEDEYEVARYREREGEYADVLLDPAVGEYLRLAAMEDDGEMRAVEQAMEADGGDAVGVNRADPWGWNGWQIVRMLDPRATPAGPRLWAWDSWLCMRDCWREVEDNPPRPARAKTIKERIANRNTFW